jgi:hypothetical protein
VQRWRGLADIVSDPTSRRRMGAFLLLIPLALTPSHDSVLRRIGRPCVGISTGLPIRRCSGGRSLRALTKTWAFGPWLICRGPGALAPRLPSRRSLPPDESRPHVLSRRLTRAKYWLWGWGSRAEAPLSHRFYRSSQKHST